MRPWASQFGYCSPEPAVLSFQHLQTVGLIHLQAAVLHAPAVIALLADAEGSVDTTSRFALAQPNFGLPKMCDNLLNREPLPAMNASISLIQFSLYKWIENPVAGQISIILRTTIRNFAY